MKYSIIVGDLDGGPPAQYTRHRLLRRHGYFLFSQIYDMDISLV